MVIAGKPLSTTALMQAAYPHGAQMSRCAIAKNIRRAMVHWGYRVVGRADTVGHPILWSQ